MKVIRVEIWSLAISKVPMFAREFTRSLEADDYVLFWKTLGHCHIKVK